MSACYIAAVGLANALGQGVGAAAPRLFAGDTGGMVSETGWLPEAPVRVGRVPGALPEVADPRQRSRNNAIILAALAEIREAVAAAIARVGPARFAVVLGTSTSGIAEGEDAIAARRATGRFPDDFSYLRQEIGAPAPFLAAHLGVTGPAYTISTACTSSAKALASARRLLALGIADAVLAGGADALCRLTINGFAAVESASPEVCNPLSVNRKGINIGEGAALLLLTRDRSGCALLGVGDTSDAYHISAPDPSGRGAELAMRTALADAGLEPGDVGYLNLHATATIKNDEMETQVTDRVFPKGVRASGTKPLTGHTLGAAGATEAAFCWLALRENRLPPHVWDGQADPALPRLRLAQPGDAFAPGRRIAMSNSFAFGGSNVSLVLGEPE